MPASSCVQAMTSAPRGTWAKVREELSSNNAAAFEAIDKALFVVCLDSEYWERISDVASGLRRAISRARRDAHQRGVGGG